MPLSERVFLVLFNSSSLIYIFSAVTFVLAIYILLSLQCEDNVERLSTGRLRWLHGIIVSGLSSIMGIAGGSLSMSLLTYYHYPIRRTLDTTSAIGLIIAVPDNIGTFISGLDTNGLLPS